MIGLFVLFVSCSEKEEPMIEPDPEPQINCVESQSVEGWKQDTLVTGYIFNYPDYIVKFNKNQIRRVYKYDGDSTRINLEFGSCEVEVDPCHPIPYSDFEIEPPTENIIKLHQSNFRKSIEVCENDTLHSVLYYNTWDVEFRILRGLLFNYIEDADKYYRGGDFYFSEDHMDDIVKMCRSFRPI